jgi:hypothetical protein
MRQDTLLVAKRRTGKIIEIPYSEINKRIKDNERHRFMKGLNMVPPSTIIKNLIVLYSARSIEERKRR